MKIISGKLKNTSYFFKNKYFQSTSIVVKKILFNWIKDYLLDKNCLDLFCGLGSLGFEAASRGAKVTLVEKNKKIFKFLLNFKNKLKIKNVKIYNYDVLNYIKKYKYIKYDLIFIDAPYKEFKKLFFFIKSCLILLKKKSLIFIESNLNLFLLLNYFKNSLKIKKNKYLGKMNFFLFEKK